MYVEEDYVNSKLFIYQCLSLRSQNELIVDVNTILKKRRSESYVRRSHKNSSNSVKS